MGIIVALDGPAGSGKGTITKLVAKRLGLVNIDTGAMYRCVTLECLNNNIKPEEVEKIAEVLENINIQLKREGENQKVLLNGQDVSKEIRTERIDENVAKFAALKIVREKITPLQQKMGENTDIIMEGRDIGTVVFPNADVKIFLDCSLEERAKRRYKQNLERGLNTPYEEILSELIKRHKLETEREVAPFIQAEDAIYLDSSNLNIEEVTEKTIQIIKEQLNKKGKNI